MCRVASPLGCLPFGLVARGTWQFLEMTSRFAQWTLDVYDVERMARFWSEALGYRIARGEGGEVHLCPEGGGVTVWLQPTAEPKRGKNRNHPDLVAAGDVGHEIARLVELGARHAEVGQRGDEPFTVLVDPEGNEFCVLHRRS